MLHLLIVCLLVALPATAQDKPDFSGRWTLVATEQAPDDVPRVMTVRQTLARTNVRGEPVTPFFKEISIAREFANERRDETHTIGIGGGFVSGVVGPGVPARPRGYLSVKWDGPALVFESGTYTGSARETGVWQEGREAWSLESDGRMRVTTTSRSSTAATDSIRTLIYQRLPPAARPPVITPFFVTEAVARGPAFFVECVNTTTTPISSGSDVWPLARSAIRMDGKPLIDEGGRIGPGLTTDVPPGGKWSGIIQLRQSATGFFPAVAFGALVRAGMVVPLTAGEHTVAVRCGTIWSEPVRFYFESSQ